MYSKTETFRKLELSHPTTFDYKLKLRQQQRELEKIMTTEIATRKIGTAMKG